MDSRTDSDHSDSLAIVATGLGRFVVGDVAAVCDPLPYLRVKKLRKYMGVQDDLAVVAASRAVTAAGLSAPELGERAGLYWATGYIPFERLERPVPAASLRDAAGCLVLERREHAESRGANVVAKLLDLNVTYQSCDPFVEELAFREEVASDAGQVAVEFTGPASLAVVLSRLAGHVRGSVRHQLQTRDGIIAASAWELP